MNRVVSYVVAGNNMGIGRNRRKERVSLIIDGGYWTNGIGWIIFDSLHLRLPLNVHSSVLLSIFAHSPQCLPPSSATPSPGQSTGVRTFKAPQNTNDQLTYFSQPRSSGPLPALCWPSDGVYQQVYHRGAMGKVLTINRLASTEPVTAAESITLLNSQRQHRPTSPHATIYQPQVCIDLLCHILFPMADISP